MKLSYFQYLDNKFRNLGLDSQIEYTLAKDGEQKACHMWVMGIRKFFMYLHIVTLPFRYILTKACLLAKDVDYSTRVEELKAYTEKVLNAAHDAQAKGESLPADPSQLVKPAITDPTNVH